MFDYRNLKSWSYMEGCILKAMKGVKMLNDPCGPIMLGEKEISISIHGPDESIVFDINNPYLDFLKEITILNLKLIKKIYRKDYVFRFPIFAVQVPSPRHLQEYILRVTLVPKKEYNEYIQSKKKKIKNKDEEKYYSAL